MVERCQSCRFWRPEIDEGGRADGEDSFGWCRRFPPVISDHMARQAIPAVGFGGHNYDPEDVATATNVHNAGLYPATYFSAWCGEWSECRL